MVLALAAGVLLVLGTLVDRRPPQPSADQAFSTPPAGRAAPPAHPAHPPLPPAEPVRLRIPAIGVDAALVRLGLDKAGALRPPPEGDPGLAGWYGGGTTPGSRGTAVTTGHVDTRDGRRGVFYRLGAVTKGERIEVGRVDGRTAVFTVDAVEVYDKAGFPSEKVYGASGRPELRVITCGGRAGGDGYRGNVVVYATLTAVRGPGGHAVQR
ncbi:class F sortase [Streptomyces triticiradicis]|uniref:class F sortase n=1 Tax=Streptomyces triticiradicis TaxID=2651189 RepID=UPI001CECDB14|nr:class F sortase [Streptomyces triticiradicis]